MGELMFADKSRTRLVIYTLVAVLLVMFNQYIERRSSQAIKIESHKSKKTKPRYRAKRVENKKTV